MSIESKLYENLAIIIPCYNCGNAVIPVVNACKSFSNQILLVNDGSGSETKKSIAACGCETIAWERNQGKGYALREGMKWWLRRGGWEILITLDSDGQHEPKEIQHLLDVYLKTEADIVLGTRRFERSGMPTVRYWANVLSSKLIALLTGCKTRDLQCGFRLFTRNALEQLMPRLLSNAYSIETEMLLTAHGLGLSYAEADVSSIYLEEASMRSAWRPLTDSWEIACVVGRYLVKR